MGKYSIPKRNLGTINKDQIDFSKIYLDEYAAAREKGSVKAHTQWWGEEGTTLELVEYEDVEGKKVYRIDEIQADGTRVGMGFTTQDGINFGNDTDPTTQSGQNESEDPKTGKTNTHGYEKEEKRNQDDYNKTHGSKDGTTEPHVRDDSPTKNQGYEKEEKRNASDWEKAHDNQDKDKTGKTNTHGYEKEEKRNQEDYNKANGSKDGTTEPHVRDESPTKTSGYNKEEARNQADWNKAHAKQEAADNLSNTRGYEKEEARNQTDWNKAHGNTSADVRRYEKEEARNQADWNKAHAKQESADNLANTRGYEKEEARNQTDWNKAHGNTSADVRRYEREEARNQADWNKSHGGAATASDLENASFEGKMGIPERKNNTSSYDVYAKTQRFFNKEPADKETFDKVYNGINDFFNKEETK